MFQEREFLMAAGHDVIDFSMADPRNVPSAHADWFVSARNYRNGSLRGKVSSVVNFVHSPEAVRKIRTLIEATRPDVVHCHNIYHQLTPSIIRSAKQMDVPVVLTLHDYKPVCPVYNRLSDGKPCSACLEGQFMNVLRRRCAEGSRGKSGLLYAEATVQRWLGSYETLDHVIAPSEFLREAVTRWRFPKERVSVVHNGVDVDASSASQDDENYLLYLGRLSPEKGLITLGEAHRDTNMRLIVAGTGPLDESLRKRFPQLEMVGHQTGPALQKLLEQAAAVVVPSECYENCPMSVLEAMAYGKPVIASRIGGIPELVVDGETGLLFEPGDTAELRANLISLAIDQNKRRQLGQAARARAEARFSLKNHNQKVLKILTAVVNDRRH
jgi:glycosyltransferase involved in cell wall biosynthesis